MHNSPTSILVVEPELQIAHASATGPCSAAHVESVQRCLPVAVRFAAAWPREVCSASVPVLFLVVAVLFVRVGHGPCSPLASALNDPMVPPDFGALPGHRWCWRRLHRPALRGHLDSPTADVPSHDADGVPRQVLAEATLVSLGNGFVLSCVTLLPGQRRLGRTRLGLWGSSGRGGSPSSWPAPIRTARWSMSCGSRAWPAPHRAVCDRVRLRPRPAAPARLGGSLERPGSDHPRRLCARVGAPGSCWAITPAGAAGSIRWWTSMRLRRSTPLPAPDDRSAEPGS